MLGRKSRVELEYKNKRVDIVKVRQSVSVGPPTGGRNQLCLWITSNLSRQASSLARMPRGQPSEARASAQLSEAKAGALTPSAARAFGLIDAVDHEAPQGGG